MTNRARWALLGVLLVAVGVAVLAAGQRSTSGPPALLPGVQRLGPEPGEPVVHYLTRAADSFPQTGTAWALVQFDDHLPPADTARVARDVRLARVVLRVPLARVQTALITRSVPGQRPEEEIAAVLRSAAAHRQAAAARAPAGSRAAAVAAAEAHRLRDGCGCVVAVLVRTDRVGLQRLAAREQVRAVHAAQVGTPPQGLALAPLLPEQREVAGPVADDGPVP